MSGKILIVEDEHNLANAVASILIARDFDPDVANDGDKGLEMALTNAYDCILLDVMLPGRNGLSLCQELKNNNVKTPVIMVSARSQISDRVDGLEAGADDYLPKPFSSNELIARIRAVLRRASSQTMQGKIRYGTLVFDPDTGEIMCDDEQILLSPKEKELMKELIKEPGRVCSKEDLLNAVWGDERDSADANNVEAYVSFLRKKLIKMDTNVRIKTLRKVGYRLELCND